MLLSCDMQILRSSNLSRGSQRAEVRSAIDAITESDLRNWVEAISVPRNFHSQPEANAKVRSHIAELLRSFGYEVELQGPLANVIALPRNRTNSVTLVGAHYDSVALIPGADDNASAVAALLACAKAAAQCAPPLSVAFAAFNCEEEGFVGSTDFVENLRGQFSIAQTHILEMVGFASSAPGSQRIPTGLPIDLPKTGHFLGLLANDQSTAQMKRILQNACDYLPELDVLGLTVVQGAERFFPVLARSDHVPFWRANIPAVMWTDTAEFRNLNYHRETDTPETLNYTFLHSVSQLLLACVTSATSAIPEG
jgi:hypothetical protein